MAPIGIILIVLGIAALIYFVVAAAKAAAQRERQRLAQLGEWSRTNGFQFYSQDPWDLDARFNGIADIGSGHSRYAYEVLWKDDPVPVFIFRYHFQTTETRTVTHTDS